MSEMGSNGSGQKSTREFDSGAGIGVSKTVCSDGVETVYTDGGDVLRITESHRARTKVLFDALNVIEGPSLEQNGRLIICVGGPSGSGKSEIGALLSKSFQEKGIQSILVPCDNYPIRFPKENDAHRLELFSKQGASALYDYLGSSDEIYFSRLAAIAHDFAQGKASLDLRKINMKTGEITEHLPIVVGDAKVLIFEGTWSCRIPGVSHAVFLDTDFRKTSDHRNSRNRTELDDANNRLFIEEQVLPAEQKKLDEIRLTLANFWLRYDEKDGASLIENKEANRDDATAAVCA